MKLKQAPEDFVVNEISAISPEKEGEYAYFSLKKKNYTTLRALQAVADALHTQLKNLGCAGNKDKIAVTEQVCSVKGIQPDSLKSISLKDIEVKPLGKGAKPVSLGDLKGNRFKIIVRDIDRLPEPKIRFINLFGEQRFSTHNAAIGKALVKRDFKQAVALILVTKSIAAIQIHKVLAEEPKNYLGALKRLPFRLLKLYVHAYQSLLWNELAKKHAETHHTNAKLPVVGFGTVPDKELDEILKREEITTRDFVIKEFPELSSEGTERSIFAEASELKIGSLEDDELNPGRKKAKLEFTLPPGCYATEFLRQLFS
ncbi:MAG: tRNA pseudouridine(13) synthase TruD [Candidatus Woesearchaeota archaeon]